MEVDSNDEKSSKKIPPLKIHPEDLHTTAG